MSDFVPDASVASNWLFEESHTEISRRLFATHNHLEAPDLFLLEMDNFFLKRTRRKVITAADAHEGRQTLRDLPIKYHSFHTLLEQAYKIASEVGCSLYDAIYVALAVRLDCQLVTADKRLYNGISSGPFSKNILWVEDLK